MYSPVDEIKSRLDIVELIQGYIKLQKAGRNYRACCPFHSEKTPSLMISSEKQMWHCFGCGKGGSVFDFIMEMEGVEFGDALRILAQKAGIELKSSVEQGFNYDKLKTKKSQLYEICDLATRFFIKQLASNSGKDVLQYLYKRGLKPETIKEWKIGYAPGGWRSMYDFLTSQGYSNESILDAGLIIKNESQNAQNRYYDRFRDRIIFPISDINGWVVGFTGRENPNSAMLDKNRMGKYINISNTLIYDKSQILYGIDKAKMDIRSNDSCILVEGQIDVLMAHQAGFKNVVACSGTALTEKHLKVIKRYADNLITAFDMDFAGETATKRGIDLAVQFGFNVEIAVLPNGQDPADCILQNVGVWTEAISKSKKIIEFYIDGAFSKNDPSSVDGKKNISKILLPIIKKISNKIEQEHWIQNIGRKIGIQENILIEEMDKIKSDDNYFQDDPPVEKRIYPEREEYVLGLLLSDLNSLEQIAGEPSQIFTNLDFREIFKRLKQSKTNKLEEFKKELPSELASQIDNLVFKAEAYKDLFDEADIDIKPEYEIKFCFKKMKDSYNRKQIIDRFK
ncbi:DNA primase [Patescibacteria group bacterium]